MSCNKLLLGIHLNVVFNFRKNKDFSCMHVYYRAALTD